MDWYPWGPEALEFARRENRPIFLSIGYAACHWCHVMERESFEDPAVADFLNRHFVSIKVDREERPDIDDIYMTAVQLLTGQGGWPLNMFLTPALEPFYGGTYFPPDARYGRAPFLDVLRQLQQAWEKRPDQVDGAARDLTERIRSISATTGAGGGASPVGLDELRRACADWTSRFDSRWGGFGPAPKFPADGALDLLLREHHRSGECVPLEAAEFTLSAMARGGIYDHIGGGFARYSVDERWLVPHFEKMLYNQALLVPVYLDAWLLTRRPLYRRVIEETLDFVRREMTDAGGGFHSSLDADSEGVEGKFYVWTPAEIRDVLGADDAALFERIYEVTDEGNFEGNNIPALLERSLSEKATLEGVSEEELDTRLRPLRRQLLDARERRVRPGTDDKVLTAWNGLMISAFARAHQTLDRPEDLDAARGAADFLLDNLLIDGRLRVTWRAGQAQYNGYLDDHAFLGRGLVDLYEAGFDPRYLEAAAALASTMIDRFHDPAGGGFWFTSDDHETLLARTASRHDGALPSGAGVACELLLRLATHLGDDRFRRTAETVLSASRAAVERMPSAYASLLRAADHAAGPILEIAITGVRSAEDTRALLAVTRDRYLPRRAIAWGDPSAIPEGLPLLAGKESAADQAAGWLCRDHTCEAPVSDPADFAAKLG